MARRLGRACVVVWGALSWSTCGVVQVECTVCDEQETYPTCHELYCTYLASHRQCATRDRAQCFAEHRCPTPYFLFCPSDRSVD